jgi:predicted PurR-regulated permease PerM
VPLAENTDRLVPFVRLATFVLVVAVLRIAQDVLMPVAFAGLLAFLLSPLVVRLTRWGLPKTLAIIATVSVAFAVLGAIAWLVTSQAISLARELPNYEENLHQKIVALKQPGTSPAVGRIADMVENLEREIQSAPIAPALRSPAPGAAPVPVKVMTPDPSPWELAREFLTPIIRPLGIAAIVVVFVVAMLFQREDLRDRFIRIVSGGRLSIATQAVDDAASRVSRYLGMLLIVNACYGVPVGIGLFFIGIPNAMLWGLLSTLLRFVPFVGIWIAASFPLALSVAVDPGWTKLIYSGALFVAVEVICTNVVEVFVYGASTGISNLALLVAATFWTWLWGPAGLVLSTPLTVCVLVLGNYVPGLNILRLLIGSEPVLEPPAQFFQRMLSMESEDMFDLASKYIDEHSLEEFYDTVFLPALLMSEEDRHSGTLVDLRERFIFDSSRELIEDLQREDETARPALPAGPLPGPVPTVAPAVIVVPARDHADEVAALMLVHLLRRRAIPAVIESITGHPEKTAINAGTAWCISALPPSAVGAARRICRDIRANHPDARIVVGMWGHQSSLSELQDRLRAAAPDEIVMTLQAAVEDLERRLGRTTDRPMQTPAAGGNPPLNPAPAANRIAPE